MAVGAGAGQWSRHSGPSHSIELRVTSVGGRGTHPFDGTHSLHTGAIQTISGESNILGLFHLDSLKLVNNSGKRGMISLHPKGDVMIKKKRKGHQHCKN